MKVKIQRIDQNLPLPVYETKGSVGFDILAREDITIVSGTIELIPGNVIIECPEGYMLAVASRSSTPRKKGLTMPHGFGVIDKDYCGPKDEIKIQVYNFTDQAVTIHRGDKIAQGLFVRVDTFEFEEVDQIKEGSRGGFGSTDRCESSGPDSVGSPEGKKSKVLFASGKQDPSPSGHQEKKPEGIASSETKTIVEEARVEG